MSSATNRQTWAIFCMTKKDHRPFNLTLEKASEIIGKLKAGETVTDCPCGETHQLKPQITEGIPDKDFNGRIVILEAVFDDSDTQVDYFARDRTLKDWLVCGLQGKVVTEAKLRKALTKLPAWLQAYKWTYEKPEKYSMSDHYFGQLRMDEGTGLSVTKPLTYSSETRGVGFILSTYSSLESWKVNNEVEPLPQSLEEIRRFIEEKQRKEEERLNDPERKLRIAKAHADTIANSTAVIDGRGFHVLTEQEKKEEIAQVVQKFAPAINQVEQKEEFCSCGVPKRLCIEHSKPKPKTGTLADYF